MKSRDTRRVLLVNPWIHDFAAFDFWARPLGLFWLGGLLLESGFSVDLFDLTDPLSPFLPEHLRPARRSIGAGRFYREEIPRPDVLPNIMRRFCRYGLPPEIARIALETSFEKPDAVLMTSMMTYWASGVRESVELVKSLWPDVPVYLGGVYATLCAEHARAESGADLVFSGALESNVELLSGLLGKKLVEPDFENILPAHQLARHADAAALMTSRGCPYNCIYCGVKALHPQWDRLSSERVEREIHLIVGELGIRNLALFDDAFLADNERALDIMRRMAAMKDHFEIHAASGISIRGLKLETARAMKRAGFRTVRIGLETADPATQRRLGGKVTNDEFEAACANLAEAGFSKDEVGVYVMVGLPEQNREEVERSVDLVLQHGLRVHLTEYSPIPGSPLFEASCAASRYDVSEPLLQNPTILPCGGPDLGINEVNIIKRRIAGFFRQKLPA